MPEMPFLTKDVGYDDGVDGVLINGIIWRGDSYGVI
jgi:hypothetical protein